MRRFLLVAISAAAISACSEGRERRVLSIDSTLDVPDLTLPDTVTRRDTSAVVATRTEAPVSPVEQQAKPEPPAAKPSKPVRRRSRPAPAPETSVDTSVQAYAPGVPESARPVERLSKAETAVKAGTAVNKPDTLSRSADSTALARDAATTPRDTARSLARDTAAPRVDTAVVAAESPSRADTVTTSPAETVAPRPDTSSTTPADTMVASPPAEPPVQPTRSAAELAARTLRVGTQIHAQLDDSITSRRDTVGQIVSAHVMENVNGPNGRTLIPAGAQVRFTITRLRPSRSKGSQGRLGLRVDSIDVNGRLETVKAETRPVPRELRGRPVSAEDAAKIGGGAAAGAVIGGVVGGNTRGAVIGGVAGAAAGTVLATQTKTRDVVVKAKTPVVFVLTAPLVVAP